jgi:5-methylcytosine-specific restriction endonuclease McrBC regulatory subunit McrC
MNSSIICIKQRVRDKLEKIILHEFGEFNLHDVKISDFPPIAWSYLTPIAHNSGTISVRTEGIIGAFRLNNGRSVWITPRIGANSFHRMLMVGNGIIRLEGKSSNVGLSHESDIDNKNALAELLFASIDEINSKGKFSQRTKHKQRANSLSGKLHLTKTLLSVVRLENEPIHQTVSTKSFDISENRVISKALNLIAADGIQVPKIYARWGLEPHYSKINQDITIIQERLAKQHYSGQRNYYEKALSLSLLIIASCGLSMDDSNEVEGEAFSSNLPLIFEKYALALFRQAYLGQAITVTKAEKNSPDSMRIIDNDISSMIPDILVKNKNVNALIADAKYKLKDYLNTNDLYQMYTYLSAYNVEHGIIVKPCLNGITRSVQHRFFDGKIMEIISISFADIKSSEKWVISHLRSLI